MKKIVGIFVIMLMVTSGFASFFGIIKNVNADPGDVVDSFDSLGDYPKGFAWDGQYLWLTDTWSVKIYKINVSGGSDNNPPEKPFIEGRVDGIPNTWYEFRFSSTDPDGDILTIFVDWGDGQNENTQGVSGEIKFLYHAWNASGDYTIRAQATDEHGAKSEWATSPIHMPKTKDINAPLFLQKFFQCFPFFEKILNQYTNNLKNQTLTLFSFFLLK